MGVELVHVPFYCGAQKIVKQIVIEFTWWVHPKCRTLHIMTELIVAGKTKKPCLRLRDVQRPKHSAVSAKLTRM